MSNAGLNPDGHPPFISVYLDDIIIFSESFEGHFHHLQALITRLSDAGQAIQMPFHSKAGRVLGHLTTPQGISPNPKIVSNFPVCKSVKGNLLDYSSIILSPFHNALIRKEQYSNGQSSIQMDRAVFKWTEQYSN